mmetsp:Transcript_36880/g.85056  ORF Transcript_36880/g.85056 Transcript_36880/m.85056 type:complete len:122 (+) Transcript_36880:94-459(+)
MSSMEIRKVVGLPGVGSFVASMMEHKALLEYQLWRGQPGTAAEGRTIMEIERTFVPPELRGQGMGGKLAKAAFEDARMNSMLVLPTCSFLPDFLKKNPEYQEMCTTVDTRSRCRLFEEVTE